ncbi:DUF2326 domain-containing protein [Listeria newyorkensis]|uniref:DUF2326 domain-containing protein n=1 Tax=Listeria newyorkensis TaxID=1497681 RepID=A0A841Z166_9LIST|nr:DUF2326 domain-containing protein [Listeria newyorkensis]MBC1458506.1 DUF2326 domain-containing protein [Listeria newyorkensis]
MYIKMMKISETVPEYKEIRNIEFKKHMNFIVDGSTSRDEKGNSVGKTTVLRLIDICLGSDDRKFIYHDAELNNVNAKLEKYITEQKIFVELHLVDDLDRPEIEYQLKVGLFPRGKRYINNQVKNKEEYNMTLNQIIFNNNNTKPSFRQLIKMFVRIDQKDDNNRFLKFINYNVNPAVYENIYSFLFRLNDSVRSEQVLRLKEEIKKDKKNVQQFKIFHNIRNENALKQKLFSVEHDIDKLSSQMNHLMDSDIYKENEENVQLVRVEYSKKLDELDRQEFKLSKIESNLEKAEKENNVDVDMSVLKNLYTEVESNLKEINQTFNELVNFHHKLVRNKIEYYEAQKQVYTERIRESENSISEFFEDNQDIIMLIENTQVAEYQEIKKEQEHFIEDKGRILEVIERLETLQRTLKKNEETLRAVPDSEIDEEEICANFNMFFTEYSEDIIRERYIVYPTGDTFPIGISNEDTGFGTGVKKSAIAAFDLAYQSFSKEFGIESPNFIVHDVLESMDSVAIDSTIAIANKIDCQYIIAVLQEKITDSGEISSEDTRLVLTTENKLFRI